MGRTEKVDTTGAENRILRDWALKLQNKYYVLFKKNSK